MIGSLIGGLKAVREMRRLDSTLTDEMRHELARRNRLVGEDPTRLVDAAYNLGELDRLMRRRTSEARATAALAGLPAEREAAAKEQTNRTVADATARVALDADSRRRRADSDYEQRRRELQQLRMRLLGNHAREAVIAGSYL